jgi:PAS domain S-box-containing protein
MKSRAESSGRALRKRAEGLLIKKGKGPSRGSPEDPRKLVHELSVHQIELELQNEELRHAQAVIEESRSQYVDLYDFAPVGYFTLTASGEIRDVNLQGARMLGEEKARLRGDNLARFVASDSLTAFRDHLRRVSKSGQREHGEVALVRKKGIFYAALESVAAKEGKSPSIRTAVIDVTDRVSAERERIRLASAIEQAADAVAITLADGTLLYVNRAFETIYGRPRREALGKRYFDLAARAAGEEDWLKAIRAAMIRGGSWTGQVKRPAGSGRFQELRVKVSPIELDSDRLRNFLIIESDVTRELELEEHLRRVQKFEALGTLAGGIAHDLNNILGPILVSAEMILGEVDENGPLRKPLEVILRASQRGRDLVKRVLSFAARREPQRESVRLAEVVEDALAFLRSSLPSTIEIRSDIDRDAGSAFVDPNQIHQILTNLAANAAYAMRDTAGTLDVSLARVDLDESTTPADLGGLKSGPYLRLTVRDSGPGIRPEILDRVFDPFFTTKKPGEGTGMGLSVVRGIVQGHGGAVIARSEPGHGAAFHVFIPVYAETATAESLRQEVLARGEGRVLLIDDEETQVQSWTPALERLGYQVTARTSVKEALGLFRQDPGRFDLVITDQTMPQMTGLDLAGEMLRLRPGVPVILCTGYSESVDEAKALAAGIRTFLMKPFGIREMAAAVAEALNETRLNKGSAEPKA